MLPEQRGVNQTFCGFFANNAINLKMHGHSIIANINDVHIILFMKTCFLSTYKSNGKGKYLQVMYRVFDNEGSKVSALCLDQNVPM